MIHLMFTLNRNTVHISLVETEFLEKRHIHSSFWHGRREQWTSIHTTHKNGFSEEIVLVRSLMALLSTKKKTSIRHTERNKARIKYSLSMKSFSVYSL